MTDQLAHSSIDGGVGISNNPLRIAVVAESFLPLVNGVTNSVLRVAEQMTIRGHHVEIIAPAPGESIYEGVPVHRVESLPVPFYRDMRIGYAQSSMRDLLERIKPDVVHLAAPTILGRAALMVANELRIPTVAIFQTDLAGFAAKYGFKVAGRGIWKLLSSVHDRADLTLAPSTASVWDMRHRGVSNVKRWMRGVDGVRFNPSHQDLELRRRIAPNGEVIIGYVGRLAKEKQVDLLAPICEMQGVKVVIVGDGPYREKLETLLPSAHFVGFKSGDELGKYYASLDVFVHTGTDETFCQAVQEALSSGVPVVAPATGGPLDLVVHGHNGYLWVPNSETSLIGGVDELVNNPLKRERLAANARGSVEHRTWPAVMDELEGHYMSVVGGLAFAYKGMAL